MNSAPKSLRGEAIYSDVGIIKAPEEFIDSENIFDGDRTCPCATLSSNNYEGGSGYFYFTV